MEDIQQVLNQLVIDEEVHIKNVKKIKEEKEKFEKSMENKEFYFKILLQNKENMNKNMEDLNEMINDMKVELKIKKEEFKGIELSHNQEIQEKFDDYLLDLNGLNSKKVSQSEQQEQ